MTTSRWRTKCSAKNKKIIRLNYPSLKERSKKNTLFFPISWFLNKRPTSLYNGRIGTVKEKHILLQISTTALLPLLSKLPDVHSVVVQLLELVSSTMFSSLSYKELDHHKHRSTRMEMKSISITGSTIIFFSTFCPLKYSPPNMTISSFSKWAFKEKFALRLGPSLSKSSTIAFFFRSASSSSLITCSKSS